MEPTFDLERYLNNSQKVETRDLDFSRVRDYPLTPEEIRCLSYMMDVEAHTVMYYKGLLRTCAARDPEVLAFMSCWAYEEFFHGRAIGEPPASQGADRGGCKRRRAGAGRQHHRDALGPGGWTGSHCSGSR